jgi:hypothetical protein
VSSNLANKEEVIQQVDFAQKWHFLHREKESNDVSQ